MIDNFALGLTHGLMMLAAVLLLRRPDLDREAGPPPGPRSGPPQDTPERASPPRA